MIRTILTANESQVNIVLPEDFTGKQIEILAFVIQEETAIPTSPTFSVFDVAEEKRVNYKFDRAEANER